VRSDKDVLDYCIRRVGIGVARDRDAVPSIRFCRMPTRHYSAEQRADLIHDAFAICSLAICLLAISLPAICLPAICPPAICLPEASPQSSR